MKKIAIAGLVLIGLGLGALALFSTGIFGCFNPTGYCRGNAPDPDRIGGPSWFLSHATPKERLDYHRERCLRSDATRSPEDATSCALETIAQDAHQYCVLYFLPPIRAKDEAEEAARQRNFETCKRNVLIQHGL